MTATNAGGGSCGNCGRGDKPHRSSHLFELLKIQLPILDVRVRLLDDVPHLVGRNPESSQGQSVSQLREADEATVVDVDLR